MSRINDALKRAKAAQQYNPPPMDAPQLRPAEPEHAAGRGAGLMMPVAFVLVALLGLFLLWQMWQKHNRQPGTMENPLAETTSSASTPGLSEPANPPTTTNPPVTPIPDASIFKVQAILFSAHSPLAMIDGQTVKVGDQFNGYRVAAINERTVTLVNATETNILKLNR